MKKLLMTLAATSAALFPQMQSANAACIHVNEDLSVEVHNVECEAIIAEELAANSLGGCSFAAVTDAVAGQGQMTGEIDVEAVVYSSNPTENPMSATFRCYITVNGSPQAGASVTASGTVVVVGGGIVTYTSGSVTDDVQLCQDVSYSNGESTSECFEASTFEIPPPLVWEIVDGAVCPILVTLAGTYGPVTIQGPDTRPGGIGGDVYVNGVLVYDCPVYEI